MVLKSVLLLKKIGLVPAGKCVQVTPNAHYHGAKSSSTKRPEDGIGEDHSSLDPWLTLIKMLNVVLVILNGELFVSELQEPLKLVIN